jgi:4-amino-4-deoxy-L-arabinose transferase-like glycosyltransferase
VSVRDDPAEVAYRRGLALITASVMLTGVLWTVLAPPFRAPDEPQHVNSVLRLAYGGGWPAAGEALVGPAVDEARDQAKLETDLPGRHFDRDDVPPFIAVLPVPDGDRFVVDTGNALADPVPAGTSTRHLPEDAVDQMTQHPPLYYAVAALVLRGTGMAEARWDHQLLALRLFDVALLVPVPLLAAAAARRLSGSRPAALVAASFTLFVPQAGHIMGSVTNDALVTLSGAAVTYLCVVVLGGDLRARTAVGLGIALGVGLLTKVMVVFALPMVAAAYLVAAGSRARRLGGVLLAGAVALAVGGWWWLRNLLVLGTVQPVGIPDRFAEGEPDGLWHFLRTGVTQVTRSFFGNFGWLELRIPDPVFWTAAVTIGVLAVIALVRLTAARRAVAVLLLLPAALWLAVLANAWPAYQETGLVIAVQGRYLFAGLAALSVTTALGAAALLGPRIGRALPWMVGAACVAAASGLAFGFWGFYQGPTSTVADAAARWAGWSPLTGPQLVALVLVLVLAAGAAVLACGLFARSTALAETTAVPQASAATTAAGTGSSA